MKVPARSRVTDDRGVAARHDVKELAWFKVRVLCALISQSRMLRPSCFVLEWLHQPTLRGES